MWEKVQFPRGIYGLIDLTKATLRWRKVYDQIIIPCEILKGTVQFVGPNLAYSLKNLP